jgi:hypothetical protein
MITKHMNFVGPYIFEDGIIPHIKCNLVAETWGRPTQAAKCNVMVGSDRFYSRNTIDILIDTDIFYD